jgi:galactokinase/mevalonate kinase-like predicted kinase
LISASAPGRCGIIGNPSDIYGGRVLSCSIPSRAYCTIEAADRWELPEDPTLWNAATARLPIEESVRVSWRSDVPRSSGLAGSTALLTATVLCLLAWRGERLTPVELAELVRDIERKEANIVCGYQDAYMASLGGLQYMDFAGKHPIDAGPPGQATSLQASLPFLLVTTGVERLSGSVHGPIAERWLAGDPLVRSSIERIKDLAETGSQALLRNDLAGLGVAMNENQRLIAALGGSGEAIDQLVRDAIGCGSWAAKLAGAGMGGTVICLTPDPDDLQDRLAEKGYRWFLKPEISPGATLH